MAWPCKPSQQRRILPSTFPSWCSKLNNWDSPAFPCKRSSLQEEIFCALLISKMCCRLCNPPNLRLKGTKQVCSLFDFFYFPVHCVPSRKKNRSVLSLPMCSAGWVIRTQHRDRTQCGRRGQPAVHTVIGLTSDCCGSHSVFSECLPRA